jgi:hypothetical protein
MLRVRFVVFVVVNARQLVQRFMDEGREHLEGRWDVSMSTGSGVSRIPFRCECSGPEALILETKIWLAKNQGLGVAQF